jgi:small subunit ribosomal protein S16
MSVRIRLARYGGRKKPFYRMVVADSRSPRNGKFIEAVGTYDPSKKPAKVVIAKDRVEKWLSNGATPTETVLSLLKQAGAVEGKAQKQGAVA